MNEGVAVGSRIRRWRGSLSVDGSRYSRMCSCCGSALDAAAAFFFDDAVSLIVLAPPRVAVLRLVETLAAGRPGGGATGVRPWSGAGGRGGYSDSRLDAAGREASEMIASATSKPSCEDGPLSADSVPLSRREGGGRREGWLLMGGARLAAAISSWVAEGIAVGHGDCASFWRVLCGAR